MCLRAFLLLAIVPLVWGQYESPAHIMRTVSVQCIPDAILMDENKIRHMPIHAQMARRVQCHWACMLDKFNVTDHEAVDQHKFQDMLENMFGPVAQLPTVQDFVGKCAGFKHKDKCYVAGKFFTCLGEHASTEFAPLGLAWMWQMIERNFVEAAAVHN